jgi:hypothetical protein
LLCNSLFVAIAAQHLIGISVRLDPVSDTQEIKKILMKLLESELGWRGSWVSRGKRLNSIKMQMRLIKLVKVILRRKRLLGRKVFPTLPSFSSFLGNLKLTRTLTATLLTSLTLRSQIRRRCCGCEMCLNSCTTLLMMPSDVTHNEIKMFYVRNSFYVRFMKLSVKWEVVLSFLPSQ